MPCPSLVTCSWFSMPYGVDTSVHSKPISRSGLFSNSQGNQIKVLPKIPTPPLRGNSSHEVKSLDVFRSLFHAMVVPQSQ